MKKFDSKIVNMSFKSKEEEMQYLNDMGSKGWQCIQVIKLKSIPWHLKTTDEISTGDYYFQREYQKVLKENSFFEAKYMLNFFRANPHLECIGVLKNVSFGGTGDSITAYYNEPVKIETK